ncbi:hypothetical protein [Vacuolonema iberomarrocanum]|uniref:hypothetical protein n=1 Tax=Vacuolonema iberomarrocanum TaxID=3454632 RepID=UPI0019ED6DD3|nr:hypothetical protein [filamentous cyanobacterium LEGE 07170]
MTLNVSYLPTTVLTVQNCSATGLIYERFADFFALVHNWLYSPQAQERPFSNRHHPRSCTQSALATSQPIATVWLDQEATIIRNVMA